MKKRKYRSILTAWACILLIVLIAGIIHIDRVCGQRIDQIAKQQTDTLDQIMELRRDIDTIEQTQAPTLSDEDLDLITRVVMAEAR